MIPNLRRIFKISTQLFLAPSSLDLPPILPRGHTPPPIPLSPCQPPSRTTSRHYFQRNRTKTCRQGHFSLPPLPFQLLLLQIWHRNLLHLLCLNDRLSQWFLFSHVCRLVDRSTSQKSSQTSCNMEELHNISGSDVCTTIYVMCWDTRVFVFW
jgi:hypothetical protein